jgi:hypothetical protein
VSVKEIRRFLQFLTITPKGMPFSCKRTTPFSRHSIAGSMVDALLLHKTNQGHSRPRTIEPVNQESTDIGYLFWGPRTTPKPRRTRSPVVEMSAGIGIVRPFTLFWTLSYTPVRSRHSSPPTSNAYSLVYVSGQRMQSVPIGCRTSETFRMVYIAR